MPEFRFWIAGIPVPAAGGAGSTVGAGAAGVAGGVLAGMFEDGGGVAWVEGEDDEVDEAAAAFV
jgi:hypothetical protein